MCSRDASQPKQYQHAMQAAGCRHCLLAEPKTLSCPHANTPPVHWLRNQWITAGRRWPEAQLYERQLGQQHDSQVRAVTSSSLH